jgi:hypothetical protein
MTGQPEPPVGAQTVDPRWSLLAYSMAVDHATRRPPISDLAALARAQGITGLDLVDLEIAVYGRRSNVPFTTTAVDGLFADARPAGDRLDRQPFVAGIEKQVGRGGENGRSRLLASRPAGLPWHSPNLRREDDLAAAQGGDDASVDEEVVAAVGMFSASPGLDAAITAYASGTVDPLPLMAATVGLDQVRQGAGRSTTCRRRTGPKLHIDPRLPVEAKP